jgi:hypothetical protein
MSSRAELLALLPAWRVGDIRMAPPPAAGSVHQTLLLVTIAGVTPCAPTTTPSASRSRERALIVHAAAHGIPAVAPLPLLDGQTILTPRYSPTNPAPRVSPENERCHVPSLAQKLLPEAALDAT